VLEGDAKTVDRLRGGIQTLATNLLGKTTIPAIAAQAALLADVESDAWWADVTLPMLEGVRRRIRSLVVLADKWSRRPVYADFADEMGDAVEVILPGVTPGTNPERFRAKARAWLLDHDDHVALQKLRRNRQLTGTDLASLEEMLLSAGVGTADDLERASTEAHGLGLFVRSLVGLDRAAAAEAFADYLQNTTYSARQLDFLNLITEHLTATGVMEAARLYESPFTDHAPIGPDFLFSQPEIEGIVVILDDIRRRAMVQGDAFGADAWPVAR